MKLVTMVLALVFLMAVWGPSQAGPPLVENVQLTQRTDGSKIVDITYDVFDADGDTMAITLLISDNHGENYDFPVLNVSGDIGLGILPGTGKAIIWDLSPVEGEIVPGQFQAQIIASDQGVLRGAHNKGTVAITDFSNINWNDPKIIEEYSRADFLQVHAPYLWQGGPYGDVPVVDQLKALNPDLVIIGYVSAFSAKLSGEPETANPFMHDWFVRTRPYWVFTTEGDTAQTWPGNVVINTLNPDCRKEMLETIIQYQRSSLNSMDGVYWDYFNNALWSYGVDMQGEPDMDGNGIGQPDDPAERIAYQAAEVELVTALRDSLGEGFIQFFNGQRAYSDPDFASLADGLMYELFPTLFFPDPDMAHALDPQFQYSLFNARTWLRSNNGGPFMVFANPWRNIYQDNNSELVEISTGNQNRAVALITGGYSSWNQSGSTFDYSYAWPEVDISLGPALGPATVEGEFYRRNFKYGRVEIEMTSGEYPNPFNYRIWALGQLVEELSIPYHFP